MVKQREDLGGHVVNGTLGFMLFDHQDGETQGPHGWKEVFKS